ncbi:metallophosphoesterase [Pseudoclavibacter sp. CFCC 13796]|uniref:metallophosphoesterase family protein n=1 Tax=Pseudoclavibacter sp. CFCC 13796 TaxID=2615179 RepID=UPI0013012BCB|nr:metallophosphoesterase family protein [Pseudoclavibacter sp. CFCC 13796]KAB1661644.1 metallophosphoesterase [Pseudoclavibacter sp. CFCC 13796]
MSTDKGGATWYTSDPHFFHRLVAGLRGFDDVEAMNASIVRQWRSQVSDRDTVFVLGDVCVNRVAETLALVDGLPGRKHLITGNHDAVSPLHREAIRRLPVWAEVFDTILPFARRRLAGHDLLLSHFPYEDWGDGPQRTGCRYRQYRLPDLGLPLLHGHTHGPEHAHDRQLHVGWDAWGRLVSQTEVIAWLDGLAAGE